MKSIQPISLKQSTPKKYEFIEILRCLAAVSVMFFHFTGGYPQIAQNNLLFWLLSFGGEGVTIFFVLSGFVVSIASRNAIGTPFKFIQNRFFRIYPTYIAAVTIGLVLLFLSSRVTGQSTFENLPGFSVLDLAGNIFLISNFYSEPLYVNGVFWTLCYEMQFYIFVALSLLFTRRLWLNTLIFSSIVLFLTAALLDLGKHLNFAYFFFGVWAYVMVFAQNRLLKVLGVVSLSLFVVATPSISSAVAFATFLGLIFLAERTIWAAKGLRLTVWVGSISYSLYLFHDILGQRVINLGFRMVSENLANFLLLIFISTIVSLAIAQLSRSYLEIALSNKLRKIFQSSFS